MQNQTANGDLKDSLVVCTSRDGHEVRGRLVQLSRHAVAFEVFSHGSDLRLSEVLENFRVIFHEHTIYSGHATVSNLMTMRQAIVCTAMLEEKSWTALPVTGPQEVSQTLREKFGEFLDDWQKSYKVAPEYKNAVADLQHFLTDFRLWVEQVESGFPEKLSALAEREIAVGIADSSFSAIDALFEKYEQAASRVERGLEASHQVYARRQLQPLLLCAPFAHRAVTKPMGYAGDYGIVNMILDDPHQGDSLYAKILHRWFVAQPPAAAHRNRVNYLAARLHEETLRALRLPGKKMRAYNVGAGPAKEVQDFMAQHAIADHAEMTLVDFNEETVTFAQTVLSGAREKNNRHTQLNFIKKSVAQLLRSEGKIRSRTFEQQYEFVYCAGLFDYLTDAVCQEFMDVLYGMVAPGGLLVVTNVDAGNPIKHWLGYVLEWHLIYRTSAEMLALRPAAADADDARVVSDPTGVNVYLEIRKPA
jgi:extracellular factor (EF) 3-hydroxypalmitic acid methyl ester biosynthesis protein